MAELLQKGINPIVGKYYWVECVQLDWFHNHVEVLPIIGPEHADPKFSEAGKHFHIDGRFVRRIHNGWMLNGKTNNAVFTEQDRYTVKKVGKKLRKCVNTETGLLLDQIPLHAKYWQWYDSMIGKSCKGKKCPHYGHEMNIIDGKLVCPLHGITADPESLKVIAI